MPLGSVATLIKIDGETGMQWGRIVTLKSEREREREITRGGEDDGDGDGVEAEVGC